MNEAQVMWVVSWHFGNKHSMWNLLSLALSLENTRVLITLVVNRKAISSSALFPWLTELLEVTQRQMFPARKHLKIKKLKDFLEQAIGTCLRTPHTEFYLLPPRAESSQPLCWGWLRRHQEPSLDKIDRERTHQFRNWSRTQWLSLSSIFVDLIPLFASTEKQINNDKI